MPRGTSVAAAPPVGERATRQIEEREWPAGRCPYDRRQDGHKGGAGAAKAPSDRRGSGVVQTAATIKSPRDPERTRNGELGADEPVSAAPGDRVPDPRGCAAARGWGGTPPSVLDLTSWGEVRPGRVTPGGARGNVSSTVPGLPRCKGQ